MVSPLTRQAIKHTLHCLLGCSIGEILGMAIGVHWSNRMQTGLAVILAFIFGYSLTAFGARSKGFKAASKLALSTDTISITTMEIIDNVIEWLIPGAINAALGQFLFWWSLAVSLLIAFVVTVPVNRLAMARLNQHH